MKSALILHGTCDKEEFFDKTAPSLSNSHWLPWLQKQFLCHNMLCQTPELPTPYNPNYNDWKKAFENYYDNDVKIVVGHSAGGGFMLKWLHKNPKVKLDKLILVAPWINTPIEPAEFLKFSIKENALDNIKETILFYSTDDEPSIIESVNIILKHFKQIKMMRFKNKGHFVYGTIGATFPELWQSIIE